MKAVQLWEASKVSQSFFGVEISPKEMNFTFSDELLFSNDKLTQNPSSGLGDVIAGVLLRFLPSALGRDVLAAKSDDQMVAIVLVLFLLLRLLSRVRPEWKGREPWGYADKKQHLTEYLIHHFVRLCPRTFGEPISAIETRERIHTFARDVFLEECKEMYYLCGLTMERARISTEFFNIGFVGKSKSNIILPYGPDSQPSSVFSSDWILFLVLLVQLEALEAGRLDLVGPQLLSMGRPWKSYQHIR
jgi:hypothetical protein